MQALSPVPRPRLFDRFHFWKDHSGLSLGGGLIIVAVSVVGLGSQWFHQASAMPNQKSSASTPANVQELLAMKNRSIRFQRPVAVSVTPPTLNSISSEEIEGRKILKIQAVPGGPIVIIDGVTGEVLEPSKPISVQ